MKINEITLVSLLFVSAIACAENLPKKTGHLDLAAQAEYILNAENSLKMTLKQLMIDYPPSKAVVIEPSGSPEFQENLRNGKILFKLPIKISLSLEFIDKLQQIDNEASRLNKQGFARNYDHSRRELIECYSMSEIGAQLKIGAHTYPIYLTRPDDTVFIHLPKTSRSSKDVIYGRLQLNDQNRLKGIRQESLSRLLVSPILSLEHINGWGEIAYKLLPALDDLSWSRQCELHRVGRNDSTETWRNLTAVDKQHVEKLKTEISASPKLIERIKEAAFPLTHKIMPIRLTGAPKLESTDDARAMIELSLEYAYNPEPLWKVDELLISYKFTKDRPSDRHSRDICFVAPSPSRYCYRRVPESIFNYFSVQCNNLDYDQGFIGYMVSLVRQDGTSEPIRPLKRGSDREFIAVEPNGPRCRHYTDEGIVFTNLGHRYFKQSFWVPTGELKNLKEFRITGILTHQ